MVIIRTIDQLLDALKRGYTASEIKTVNRKSSHAAHGPEKVGRHFCISIADHIIGINSRYPDVYALCEEYLSDQQPEIQISINEKELSFEREEAENEEIPYQNGYLETLAMYRKICEQMLDYDIFMMHGAVVAAGNNAYMFSAKSGTGKTTHIRKWIQNIKNAVVVNGDKPLIQMTDTQVFACGTPWCGKEKMGTNIMVPLRAIVLMERGENNAIKEITFWEAFSLLLQQTYRPNETEKMKKTLQLLSGLNGKVRFYQFIFNNHKEDAFDVAYKALSEEREDHEADD